MENIKYTKHKIGVTYTHYDAGTITQISYRCPCGVGSIVETLTDIPDEDIERVFIDCHDCRHHYYADTSNGVRHWVLKEYNK